MDEFMAQILDAIHEHGSRAVRIFPPHAQVLVSFADRLANEVVRQILSHAIYLFKARLGWRVYHFSIGASQRGLNSCISPGYCCLFQGIVEDGGRYYVRCQGER